MARTQLLSRLLPFPGGPGLLAQSCIALPNGFQQQCGFSSGGFSNSSEDERKEQAAPSPSLVQLAHLVNRPVPMRMPGISSGFAASPLLRTSPRQRAGPALPGMHPSAVSPARSYYTEGEIFGTTFMYTTNMMFWAGIIGAVAFRRNLIILLLSAETVMLACNMNFLFTAAYLNDITGAIMSITITTIAACETAIGLALCVAYFHMRSATDVEALNLLK
ncbi:NADH-ubiquinone oxidoreductase chain 4L [Tetrabaena socialis]|uniref:NADH-ubiquinone oxidoreductase chain 4L n=1 Tax=Tetrabaena socialis TaxID=47790 RepID=A0A2J8ADK2_9CHLO|nr:NADH-ubiquinone oxidoreductase chain 4L [Tetrabaena socialis]|eukprot:PNH10586.1 NADH-ubiquinone oxidoreductase chain 4L [Tetrabaena socialis]